MPNVEEGAGVQPRPITVGTGSSRRPLFLSRFWVVFLIMNEQHDANDQHPPRWVPYTPPAPDGWDRVRLLLRQLSFPLIVVLLAGGLAGVLFYWVPDPEPVASTAPSVNVLPSGLEAPERASAAAGTGRLRIQSAPAGATVRVNGDSVGVTPFADSTRQAGVYMLSVQQEGHFRADTVVVLDAGSAATVRFSLRPRPDYEDASPAVPEPEAQRAPRIAAAQQNRPLPVTAVPPKTAPPEATPAFGALYVTSDPPGARVTVNDTERGRTPLPLSRISPGAQRVAVALDGYQPWTGQVDVQADTTARVHASLQTETGRLRVLARPWGTIYIDDTLRVRETDVWYEAELPIGPHQITVVHPALGRQTRQVEVRAGEERSLIVDLRSQEEGATP